jgi:hypothetical protein
MGKSDVKKLVLAGVFWAASIGAAMNSLWSYEAGAGAPADPPAWWPASSLIRLSAASPTLVVFAHPKCPCTRATIEEINVLLARSKAPVSVRVLFYLPAGAAAGWAKTDLWRQAENIPGVVVAADPGGEEARRLGVQTSGQVLIYDTQGRLRYSGGITAGRGHFGDNGGLDAVAEIINSRVPGGRKAPVFGCALTARRTRGQAVLQ